MTGFSPNDRVTGALVAHVVASRYESLAPTTIRAAKTFIVDSLSVGLAGTRLPTTLTLHALARTWGAGTDARVWGTGERVTASAAAFLNSYQIHNQEWDCLHEAAVVHPMAVVLATLVAYAEAAPRAQRLSGRDLLVGCSVAVDVAAAIGAAATNRLRFFRPAMCGALGATAGIAAMRHYDAARTADALGLCYSQLSGTMQAHLEGSPVLPMQIGFNARAVLNAVWLAEHGVQGPRDFLEGEHGYFALIDTAWRPETLLAHLQQPQIAQLSHKPFPSGRATHGGIDGALALQAQHGFAAHHVQAVRVLAPPLVLQLVDRPSSPTMAPSYARLCLPYVVATALLTGDVGVEDFEPDAIASPERQALARCVRLVPNDNSSLNALAPQRVEIDLADGRTVYLDLPAVLGAPQRPLTEAQQIAKARRAIGSARVPLSPAAIDELLAVVSRLEAVDDVAALVDRLVVTPEATR